MLASDALAIQGWIILAAAVVALGVVAILHSNYADAEKDEDKIYYADAPKPKYYSPWFYIIPALLFVGAVVSWICGLWAGVS